MTLKPHRKPANQPRDIIKSLAAVCLTLLFFVFADWASAAEQEPSSETVTLTEAVRIPIHGKGKQVGATTVPAGTKVTVVTRDGEKVSVKHGALEPVWVEESQVSGLTAKQPNVSEPAKTSASTTPETLSALISEKKWAEAASACETLAQQDSEKFSGLADWGNQLRSALQAKAAALAEQNNVEAEANRLRRNADVVGQPNRLNPSDRSPKERAQKLRNEADAIVEESPNNFTEAQSRIVKLGDDISSQISLLSDKEKASEEDDKPEIAFAADATPENQRLADQTSALSDSKTVRPPPKGQSIEFKGFSLNLSRSELFEVLKKRTGPNAITLKEIAFTNSILGSSGQLQLLESSYWVKDELGREIDVCVATWDASGEGHMLNLLVSDPIVSDLFNSHDLDFEDFVSQFITTYDIERVKTKRSNAIDNEYIVAYHDSGLGWAIEISDRFPDAPSRKRRIQLFRVEPAPPARQTTFGD